MGFCDGPPRAQAVSPEEPAPPQSAMRLACAARSDHSDLTPIFQEPTDQSEGEQNKCSVQSVIR